MWRTVVAMPLAVGVLAGSGHAAAPSLQSAPTRLTFGYDRSRALDYVDRGVVGHRGAVAVHDISYQSSGERVDGFLVENLAKQRRPGIILVHGSGGDRSELLGSAVALAQRGTVTLTITEPSAAHPPPRPTSLAALLAQSRTVQVRDVIAIRRGADVLQSLPSVAPRKIGYLGWSAGAKTGAYVAASDQRFRALALLSAGADQLAAFVAAAPPALRPLVKQQLGRIDPLRYIAAARPGTVLLEDGTRDKVVPHRALLNMIDAAPRGTIVRWYPAGHGLNNAAYREAFAWLVNKLGA
jgi:dienelactone hydrolase